MQLFRSYLHWVDYQIEICYNLKRPTVKWYRPIIRLKCTVTNMIDGHLSFETA